MRFLLTLSCLVFFSCAAHSAAPQQPPAKPATHSSSASTITGTFAGTLQAGDAQLHLILHIDKSANGQLHATLDSLDQAVYAIEATSVSYSTSTLKLQVASVGARFEGSLSPDGKIIDGTWSQGAASLPLTFKRQLSSHAAGSKSAPVSPVEGLWQAALETHGMRLRFQLHVSHDTEGKLVAALDNLDQGVTGLPAVDVTFSTDSRFVFEIPSVAGKFEGVMDPTKKTLKGKWSQTGAEEPLEFKRSDTPLPLRRPQNPVPPYPYLEEDVVVHNSAAGVDLAGTLTLPKTGAPFPAVILIAGSGPFDRDETISGHKPFLVLADHFTRDGIAVLRYDKRGIGKSTGSADSSTTLDFASDAQAAVQYLKSRKDIDPNRIGLLGHSEGAMIAPYLAVQSPDIKWLVLLGAPATNGEQTLLHQSELLGEVGGLSQEQLMASLGFDQAAYDVVRHEKDPAAIREKITALVRDSGLDAALPPPPSKSSCAP